MDNGAVALGGIPLVRRLRLALGQECQPGRLERAALRRDVDGLLERMERLRRRFPGSPGVLDRVELSSHLIELAHQLGGAPAGELRGGVR